MILIVFLQIILGMKYHNIILYYMKENKKSEFESVGSLLLIDKK